jgi:aldehyde dehydrogenase (NAD+)
MSAVVESRSPQAPDDLVLEVPAADGKAVAGAHAAASQAQREWAAAPASERAEALIAAAASLAAAAEEVAALAVREVARPWSSRARRSRAVLPSCASTPRRR